MIDWTTTPEDAETISAIVKRALRDHPRQGLDALTLTMDLSACHANGMPLRLADLRDAPAFDFAHDIFGISNHMDRETGQLTDCFVPRYSAPTNPTVAEVAHIEGSA